MKKILLFLLFPIIGFAQGYTSYFTGNPVNVDTNPSPGFCLMGGATEHDNAMVWLLKQADEGDVLILRCSGSDGYNDYIYSDLASQVTVNSVESIVITSAAGATNPYVLNKVANAEMIWFAGGDQYNYVSYFKDNALEDAINNHINVKHYPVGGTSAGMAILGDHYFSAQNGSVTSSTALSNPYGNTVTIGAYDFINIPILNHTITDTHFDNPDRKGRLMTFLARIATDEGIRSFGIAANEYVAVCIDAAGKAKVYGDYPNYQEFAYFAQANCDDSYLPETCQSGSSLTWNQGGQAVKVYKVPGTANGTNYFNLSDWQTGSGGSWENWKVINGVFSSGAGTASTCILGVEDFTGQNVTVYPVPFDTEIRFNGLDKATVIITDSQGRKVYENKAVKENETINTSNFASGIYVISIEKDGKKVTRKIVRN
ncbi:T9SS type A sorting domain-containing protein [Flavobacterium sp. 3HN19-14]|uniref:T9SS type A sorting domain-containing protein n=1 Tax=Flavobacterium sp. 3HN19-14 TaxID=3448133 RepID=UPI003EE1CACB